MEDTFRSPIRITECGHNFCQLCLLQIRGPHTLAVRQRKIRLNGRKQATRPSYNCPECRKPQFREVENLTRNYFAEKALANYTSIKNHENNKDKCKPHNRPVTLCKLIPMKKPFQFNDIFQFVLRTRKNFVITFKNVVLAKTNVMSLRLMNIIN